MYRWKKILNRHFTLEASFVIKLIKRSSAHAFVKSIWQKEVQELPPFSENLAIYIYIYPPSTIIHHPMGAYDCLWIFRRSCLWTFPLHRLRSGTVLTVNQSTLPCVSSTVSTPSTTTTRPQGGATWVNKRVGNGWARNEMSIYIWKIGEYFLIEMMFD